ncbi:MAG: DUF4446 family protein [Nitriliruptor sp.]|nr:MAG: DUF4446 family protein [Nitriliruptor sp.]
MELDANTVALLAVISTATAALLLIAVVFLWLRLRVVRRTQVRAFGGTERDILEVLADQGAAIGSLERDLRVLDGRAAELRERLRRDLSHVAIVRYDAFEDMGGALSFSAALLDERGHGLVISAINGRSETRSYAKAIVAGDSEHSLSAEELEAIDAAMTDRPATAPPPSRRGRRRAS